MTNQPASPTPRQAVPLVPLSEQTALLAEAGELLRRVPKVCRDIYIENDRVAYGVQATNLAKRIADHGIGCDPVAVEHRQGCDALGGYGHGVGACSCGARDPAAATVSEDARMLDWLETWANKSKAMDYKWDNFMVDFVKYKTVREAIRAAMSPDGAVAAEVVEP